MLKTACIIFDGPKNDRGYGYIRTNDGLVRAHRKAWEDKNGPIPSGLVVMHKCDNPSCWNVEHLKLGTTKQNITDMISKGRDRLVGSRNTQAKLTEEDIFFIRSSEQTGVALAKKYGVSPTAISEIKTRKKWKHI